MKINERKSRDSKNNTFFYAIFGVYGVIIVAMICVFIFKETGEAKESENAAADLSSVITEAIPENEIADAEGACADDEDDTTNVVEVTSVSSSDNSNNSDILSSKTGDSYTTLSLVDTNTGSDSDYSITVYDEDEKLYTTARVNVRKGPGTGYDKLCTLTIGTAVTVTGETDNGWYQILRDGTVGYIRSDFLGEKTVATSYIFAGDSRTVQMSQAVSKSEHTWIAQVGEGYDYFVNTAIPQIDASITDGCVIIINYGVNDLHNVDKYISKINSKIDSWIEKGATVYYAAVLPVSDYPTITNADIESFNSTIRSGLDSRIGWLDGYTYLQTYGFNTADGLHFDYDTYRNLYAYYMSEITE